jgi:hypothetical protein
VSITEILLVILLVLQAVAQACMTLTIYNTEGEKTRSLRVFLPWIRKGALCSLLGFIRENDDFTPIYRPLIAWASEDQQFVVECNLSFLSLAVFFSSQFPFVAVVTSASNEKLF